MSSHSHDDDVAAFKAHLRMDFAQKREFQGHKRRAWVARGRVGSGLPRWQAKNGSFSTHRSQPTIATAIQPTFIAPKSSPPSDSSSKSGCSGWPAGTTDQATANHLAAWPRTIYMYPAVGRVPGALWACRERSNPPAPAVLSLAYPTPLPARGAL
jgi:hypothetical protein